VLPDDSPLGYFSFPKNVFCGWIIEPPEGLARSIICRAAMPDFTPGCWYPLHVLMPGWNKSFPPVLFWSTCCLPLASLPAPFPDGFIGLALGPIFPLFLIYYPPNLDEFCIIIFTFWL
jgi:hypothetical protein